MCVMALTGRDRKNVLMLDPLHARALLAIEEARKLRAEKRRFWIASTSSI